MRALGDACRLERTKQFAVRAVRLPESADPERINASYDNGVLTVKARGLPAGLPGRRSPCLACSEQIYGGHSSMCLLHPGACTLSDSTRTVSATLVSCALMPTGVPLQQPVSADHPLPVQIPKSEQKTRKKEITVG